MAFRSVRSWQNLTWYDCLTFLDQGKMRAGAAALHLFPLLAGAMAFIPAPIGNQHFVPSRPAGKGALLQLLHGVGRSLPIMCLFFQCSLCMMLI